MNRNARFLVTVERPHPSHEAYELYLDHKRRFELPPGARAQESYEEYVETFFQPFPIWEL